VQRDVLARPFLGVIGNYTALKGAGVPGDDD
jgi:hypothetical protein